MAPLLSKSTDALLIRLRFRADAKRVVYHIPLGSICWDDEVPDVSDPIRVPEDEQNLMWRLFIIRFKIWDSAPLPAEDQ